jgi:hypothetical protein
MSSQIESGDIAYWASRAAAADLEIEKLREMVELERTLREQTVDARNTEIARLRTLLRECVEMWDAFQLLPNERRLMDRINEVLR